MAKRFVRNDNIEGFSISYESEKGKTFVSASCPFCPKKEEAVQENLDAGRIVVSKLKAHIKASHPEKVHDNPKWN